MSEGKLQMFDLQRVPTGNLARSEQLSYFLLISEEQVS